MRSNVNDQLAWALVWVAIAAALALFSDEFRSHEIGGVLVYIGASVVVNIVCIVGAVVTTSGWLRIGTIGAIVGLAMVLTRHVLY